jgi:hypothetical protein
MDGSLAADRDHRRGNRPKTRPSPSCRRHRGSSTPSDPPAANPQIRRHQKRLIPPTLDEVLGHAGSLLIRSDGTLCATPSPAKAGVHRCTSPDCCRSSAAVVSSSAHDLLAPGRKQQCFAACAPRRLRCRVAWNSSRSVVVGCRRRRAPAAHGQELAGDNGRGKQQQVPKRVVPDGQRDPGAHHAHIGGDNDHQEREAQADRAFLSLTAGGPSREPRDRAGHCLRRPSCGCGRHSGDVPPVLSRGQGCCYEVDGASARRLNTSLGMWRLSERIAWRLVLTDGGVLARRLRRRRLRQRAAESFVDSFRELSRSPTASARARSQSLHNSRRPHRGSLQPQMRPNGLPYKANILLGV